VKPDAGQTNRIVFSVGATWSQDLNNVPKVRLCQKSHVSQFSRSICFRKYCVATQFKRLAKQENPMVRIWTDDGVDGTGRSYTIGTGGSAVVALLRDYMAPWRLGRDAAMVEEILERTIFCTRTNSVGRPVSLAFAAEGIAKPLDHNPATKMSPSKRWSSPSC
jgi:hypothetical protein